MGYFLQALTVVMQASSVRMFLGEIARIPLLGEADSIVAAFSIKEGVFRTARAVSVVGSSQAQQESLVGSVLKALHAILMPSAIVR